MVGQIYYYLYNLQNDVIGLLDSAGTQVVGYRYNSWGKPLSVTDTMADKAGSRNPFRYRGYCWDEETGLYYANSRYYDPETGRFVNADDVEVLSVEQGNLNQYNLYAYCLNNPINRLDEDGNLSIPNWAKVAVGAVATVAAVGLTIATGGAVLPILTSVAISTLSGAAIGYVTGGKEGAINGAADGFMWGGIGALATSAVGAVKTVKTYKKTIDAYSVSKKQYKGTGKEVFQVEVTFMRIKHHYYLEMSKRLRKFLDKNHIEYEIDNAQSCLSPRKMLPECEFVLYKDQKCFRIFKILFPFAFSMVDVEYSPEEIETAEWLTVRSINAKVNIEFEEKAFKNSCPYVGARRGLKYRHTEKVGPFSTKKKIKWKTNHFFCGLNTTGENYMFCPEKTKKLISGLWTGLEFWPVKKYNTEQEIGDLYQMHFEQVLPLEAFVLTGKEKVSTCKFCGKKKICINETYQLSLNKAYMERVGHQNVYTTESIWTYDRTGWHTFSFNIVSHDFYQFCKENKIGRGLVYEPIKMV